MNKVFILFFFQMLYLNLTGWAQHHGQVMVYLTNYTIDKNTGVVGYVKVRNAELQSVTVDGKNKGKFKINKDRQLMVVPGELAKDASWVDVALTVKTSSGEHIKKTFRIVKDAFVRNKVIAHRGAWKNTNVPENSIAALQHAMAMGCEGSEFDVHMSADLLPVVNHDPSIQGVSIAKTNADELLTLRLSNGEPMPTLENYLLEGTKQNRTKLILEIKPSELGKEYSIALARKVVTLVEGLQAQGWVDYISFDYDVCKEVMQLAPYAKVAYLKGDKRPDELAADHFFGLDYHFNVLQKNPHWIKEAKAKKLTINVWTVNDKPVMEDLLKQDVDFITTNEPELLLSIVK